MLRVCGTGEDGVSVVVGYILSCPQLTGTNGIALRVLMSPLSGRFIRPPHRLSPPKHPPHTPQQKHPVGHVRLLGHPLERHTEYIVDMGSVRSLNPIRVELLKLLLPRPRRALWPHPCGTSVRTRNPYLLLWRLRWPRGHVSDGAGGAEHYAGEPEVMWVRLPRGLSG